MQFAGVIMSKLTVSVPLEQIERISLVLSEGKEMSRVKGDADLICNAGFYDMAAYRPVGHLKAAGKVLSQEPWNCWGYVWDQGEDIHMAVVPDTPARNYISGVELLTAWSGPETALQYNSEVGGSRPRTAIAMSRTELLLFCTDEGMTPEQLRQTLYEQGAVTALMLDSGGSSQCDFGKGKKIDSSRRVHNYLGVWLKNEEEGKEKEHMGKTTVCLDPGHGAETAGKCSPDQSYYEHEFNLDMAMRCREILERHGVTVVLTRNGESDVTLAQRVKTANENKELDLFVSLHSNANGTGAEWTETAGYCVYTSAAGESAGRNRAARALLERARESGISLFGTGLFHRLDLYVLKNTVAPAVLIEHGFHTNRKETERLKSSAYREKLAETDCKGILDYLGISWKEEEKTEKGGVVCPHCGGALQITKG